MAKRRSGGKAPKYKRSHNSTSWGKNRMGGRWSVRAPWRDGLSGANGMPNQLEAELWRR